MRDEGIRNQKDPNYRWYVADIASFEAQRKQKTLSLNLVERKAERERLDAERLARENERLTQQGLAPLKTNEELEANTDKRPDIVLDQTAQMLADVLVTPPASPAPPVARDAPREGQGGNSPRKAPAPRAN
jgi:hypothetical protein